VQKSDFRCKANETICKKRTNRIYENVKAVFDGTYVTAPHEAKVFYEQSGYGRVEKNGNVRFSGVEALYLLARGKISIEGSGFDAFLSICSENPEFLRNYIVYRDIRERGYVITAGPQDYRVFPRGQRPGHGQSRYLVRVFSERGIVDFPALLREAETAANMRKQFVLAVADDEHELTYYEIRIQNLANGRAVPGSPPEEAAEPENSRDLPEHMQALRAGSAVYVREHDTETLQKLWFGTPLGDERLFLSSEETAWLLEQKLLTCTPAITAEEFEKLAGSSDPEFSGKMVVYRHLRETGFFPRTGYKYGHHFRVYTNEGKHSEMLIHACPEGAKQPMSAVSRSVRLAHSVKKKMLFGCIAGNSVTFIEFARMKL
jgi:tRNA-intron endonuclease